MLLTNEEPLDNTCCCSPENTVEDDAGVAVTGTVVVAVDAGTTRAGPVVEDEDAIAGVELAVRVVVEDAIAGVELAVRVVVVDFADEEAIQEDVGAACEAFLRLLVQ
jgi:hypothetical protein